MSKAILKLKEVPKQPAEEQEIIVWGKPVIPDPPIQRAPVITDPNEPRFFQLLTPIPFFKKDQVYVFYKGEVWECHDNSPYCWGSALVGERGLRPLLAGYLHLLITLAGHTKEVYPNACQNEFLDEPQQ